MTDTHNPNHTETEIPPTDLPTPHGLKPPKRRKPKSTNKPGKSSPRRQAASQANGALGKGRKTPEDKAISAMNSLRRGLLAKFTVLPTESNDIFNSLHAEFDDYYRPQSEPERICLEDMISTYWRIRRLRSLENISLHAELNKQKEKDAPKPPSEHFKASPAPEKSISSCATSPNFTPFTTAQPAIYSP